MRIGELFTLMFILILVGLLARYYKGVVNIVRTGGSVMVETIETLQLR